MPAAELYRTWNRYHRLASEAKSQEGSPMRARLLHWGILAPPISGLGQKRQMRREPTGGLFPLFPKTGNVNAQQQNVRLVLKRTFGSLCNPRGSFRRAR